MKESTNSTRVIANVEGEWAWAIADVHSLGLWPDDSEAKLVSLFLVDDKIPVCNVKTTVITERGEL